MESVVAGIEATLSTRRAHNARDQPGEIATILFARRRVFCHPWVPATLVQMSKPAFTLETASIAADPAKPSPC